MAKKPRPVVYDRVRTHLDARVYGQAAAKDALTGAAMLHARGVSACPVLLVGATGTGKTLLARTLAEALGLPFAAIDASQIVPDGYVGSSVSSRLTSVVEAASRSAGNLRGLVFVDEIDKLGRTGEKRFRDQAAAGLLSLLNGDPMEVQQSWLSSTPRRTDTLMVVAAGAFQGVREEVRKRRNDRIGFHARKSGAPERTRRATRDPITLEDIREHGELQPELVARFRKIATLDVPGPDDLAKAARTMGELRALVASVRKRRRTGLVFGASWFRRWAEHAAEDAESSYRALHGPFQRVALHLVRALDSCKPNKTMRPLLLTGDTFDVLLDRLPTDDWIDARFAETEPALAKAGRA